MWVFLDFRQIVQLSRLQTCAYIACISRARPIFDKCVSLIFRQICQFWIFDKCGSSGASPTLLCSSSLFADLVAFPAVLAVEGRGFVELFLGYQSFGQ